MLWLGDLLVPSAQEVYANLDWSREARELQSPTLRYPAYYLAPHHGFARGYFSAWQALGWDFIERLFGVPRIQGPLLDLLATGAPAELVDLGCGTATMDIALARRLPHARFTLIDLSPYQLAAARRRIQRAGLASRARFAHAAAEATQLDAHAADLVFATLLFHELPSPASHAVLAEARRIVRPGGRVVLFDAIQRALPWRWADRAVNAGLAAVMREVYWTEYQRTPIWEVCAEAGFERVERRLFFAPPWVYQAVIAWDA